MTQICYTLNGLTMTGDQVFQLAITEQQRAEAAESRAVTAESHNDSLRKEVEQWRIHVDHVEAERDELRRQLSEAQRAIDVLSNIVVAQDAEIKRLEQEREDVAEYRAEIARLTRKAATIPPHTQEALNEGDGVYRP